MARNGKIARLPLHIRNELNHRLSEGEPGVELVEWLNDKAGLFLKTDAKGNRLMISEQNLSEWRQGGYQDWLRHEEARQFTQDLAEQAGELDAAADGKGISDRFGALLAVDMARLAKKFLEEENDPEKRWARLKEISKELSRLRRDEHRAVWTWIKREQWERRREREDYEEEETIRKEVRREQVAPLLAAAQVKGLASEFGGGPGAMETAALMLEAQQDLEPGCLSGSLPVRAGRATPSEGARCEKGHKKSGQIKPNPTKSGLKNGLSKTSSTSPRPSPPFHGGEGETLAASRREPADGQPIEAQPRHYTKPAKSDQIKVNPTKNVARRGEEGEGPSLGAPSGVAPSKMTCYE